MSAWMVTDAHVDLLATAYVAFVDHSADPQAIGQQLLRDNATSIRARYEDRHGMADEGDAQAEGYVFRRWLGNLDPGLIYKQIRCSDYQSCEFDAWQASEGFAILTRLTEALPIDPAVGGGTGDDDYPWGIDCHPEDRTEPEPMPAAPLIMVVSFEDPAMLQFLLPIRS